ncbi:MAG: choice-of-anchor Q domain-containing protein [Actinomycetota bacterium]
MSKRQRKRQEKQRRHGTFRPSRRRIATGATLTVGATLVAGSTAQAGTFTVTSLADPGDGNCIPAECTLREGIAGANANLGELDNVVFDSSLSGTVSLNSPLPTIADEGAFISAQPGAITVDGPGNASVFVVDTDASYQTRFTRLTITGGGGVGVTGGGGIRVLSGDVLVIESTITGNSAPTGGGIFSPDGSRLGVYYSTIYDNSADFGGGMTVFDGYMSGSTISGNHAESSGGGMYVFYSDFDTYNSTIYDNDADAGGGVFAYNDNLSDGAYFDYVTFDRNFAYTDGGNLYMDGGGDAPTLRNTIVADGLLGPSGINPDSSGDLNADFSLVEDGSTAITETVPNSNITGVDPQLGPLADHTSAYDVQTQAPAPTSPAVDQGNSSGSISWDQRLEPRPFDFSSIANSSAAGADGADIGAFELQPSDIPASGGGAGAGAGAGGAAVVAPKCKGKTATIFARPGLARTFNGTNKKDVIVGTNAKDTINAKGGNDTVCAKGGKDTVKGGGGKDKLYGQGGADKLVGGGGNDKLVGGGGGDKLLGKGGNDTCVGGAGKDVTKSC